MRVTSIDIGSILDFTAMPAFYYIMAYKLHLSSAMEKIVILLMILNLYKEDILMISPNFQIQQTLGKFNEQRLDTNDFKSAVTVKKDNPFLSVFKNAIKNNEADVNTNIPFGEAMKSDRGILSSKESEMINDIKVHLLSKYGSLDRLNVEDDALKSLKQYLLDAGFDEGAVTEIMEIFSKDKSEGGMTLSELFDLLGNIESQSNWKESEPVLDMSMLPYIQSILTSIGLSPDVAASLIDGAKDKGQGINLSELISNLQNTEKEAFLTGNLLQSSPDDNQIHEILEKMGLGNPIDRSKPLTLEEFVQALESYRNDAKAGLFVNDVKLPLDLDNDNLKTFFSKIQIEDNSILNKSESSVIEAMKSDMAVRFADERISRISEIPNFVKGR